MADDEQPPDAEAADPTLEGLEVLALRIGFDLVPEWSNVVEKIARGIGERVAVGVDGDAFVVKVAVKPERKALFLGEMQRYWQVFVERRKRDGRWR